MGVYNKNTREPTTPVTGRIPVSLARMLEAVGAQRGHEYRTDTIREAFEEYVERHLRRKAA